MTRWIALLRGVNVNGITIRSPELRAVFEGLGFHDVTTVLASGNVLFSAQDSAQDGAQDSAQDGAHAGTDAALKARIEQALRDRFGYDAWIVLLAHDALAGIVDAYPFPESDDMHAYVVFTSDAAVHAELTEAAPGNVTDGTERVLPGGTVLYWSCPKGSSTDTPFAGVTARARYRSATTTRNVRTLRRML